MMQPFWGHLMEIAVAPAAAFFVAKPSDWAFGPGGAVIFALILFCARFSPRAGWLNSRVAPMNAPFSRRVV